MLNDFGFSSLARPLAVLSLMASALAGSAKAGSCTDVPVRFTIRPTAILMNLDGSAVTDASGNPVSVASAVLSDGNDVYTANGAIKYCEGTYDAVLNLLSGNRLIGLALASPIANSGSGAATPPPGTYVKNGLLNVRNIICKGCTNPGQPFVTRAGVQMASLYNNAMYSVRFLAPANISTFAMAADLDNDTTWVSAENTPNATSLAWVAPQPYDCVSSYPSWVVRGTLVNQAAQPNYLEVGTLVNMGKNGTGSPVTAGQFSTPFEYRIETLSCAVKPY